MIQVPEQHRITLQKALKIYGENSQIDMTIEECSELINAIEKLKRGRVLIGDVITEIADVMIMCTQMMMLFGEEEVEKAIDYKVQRLQLRMEKYNQREVI